MIDLIFPDTETTLNSIGLALDIAGVVLLFKFGLPESIDRRGHSHLILPQIDEEEKAKGKRYDRWARVGLLLLILGFSFQLLGSYF